MKESGLMTWSDPGADKALLEIPTHQCCHCGGQFSMKPPVLVTKAMTALEAQMKEQEGKKTRGYCQRCNGYICGPSCAECVPVEQLLENYEHFRPLDFRPIFVGLGSMPMLKINQ